MPMPPNRIMRRGVIESLLRRQPQKKLAAAEQSTAEADFLKTVDDDPRFGVKADLTDGGKWTVRITYAFVAEGFVSVSFERRDVNPRGFGGGDSVLYRRIGERWKLMGNTGGWTE